MRYGEPMVGESMDIDELAMTGELWVRVLEGASALTAAPTGKEDTVKRLLEPLSQAEVPIVRCIGLVYMSRIAESGFEFPKNPTSFMEGINISEANALDHVAGYVVGNDISCRDWQLEKDKAGMMQQWSFSKSFDQHAPLGPAIFSPSLLQDGSGVRLRTFVNGKVRQDSNTSDLLFGVRQLISFLSTGQKLEAGSLVMTGTVHLVESAPRLDRRPYF